ncbi:GspE/PulE family protein [Niveibacterium terrae]|uniref:GspE/PulE family protein n=1 Tax=Niveibacterium terrae TaxID=3373598 RepID=UPI003A952B12
MKPTSASGDINRRLAFFKGLQTLTARIHATNNIDEIIFELSTDICSLFAAERITLYVVDEGGQAIVSKVKTGLNAVKTIRLPISERSIAGYVALHKTLVNIHDAYDTEELAKISAGLEFRREVDLRSGFHTRQVLTAPIVGGADERLLGVIQLLNTRDGADFSVIDEEGMMGLTQTLGLAFMQRLQTERPLRNKYDDLVRSGALNPEQLEEAVKHARDRDASVETVLLDEYHVSLEQIGASMSRFYAVPYEPFQKDRIRPVALLRNIKKDYVLQSQWIPLEETHEGIIVLTVEPEQVRGARVAENVFPGTPLSFRVTTRKEFEQTVEQLFGHGYDDASVSDLLSGMGEDEREQPLDDELSAAADNELVKLVNRIIVDAYKQNASDIHIEPRPGKEKTLVRFRKDGSLTPYIEVPAAYRNSLITRIKIMCDLDISERRKPQDGKIRFRKYGPLDIELRVATLPTAGGVEDVVMRLLANGEPLPLPKLGLSPRNLERLAATIAKPYGIFFVCGPTGSGKTTTLHSILKELNTKETKIWTAEDPVEITQRGLRQVQVNRKAGLDFPTVMRAFLRADPDVIMVGEMRDQETVSIGIEASLTGHLVLSTLHTNSAPESIVRLLDMGMDPFNFSDALLGVLAQRLAKRLCQHCKRAYHPDEDEIESLLAAYCEELHETTAFLADPEAARSAILEQWRQSFADEKGQFTLFHAVGCPECTEGYRGRMGLHELMLGTDAVKHLIQTRAPVAQLLARALEDGMRTLRQDGIEKVLQGITDMKQIRKVCIR